MGNNYTLKTRRTEKGFQHDLLYNGESVRGSTTPEEINQNPTTIFLEDYAKSNEEVINLKLCKSIEIKFELKE